MRQNNNNNVLHVLLSNGKTSSKSQRALAWLTRSLQCGAEAVGQRAVIDSRWNTRMSGRRTVHVETAVTMIFGGRGEVVDWYTSRILPPMHLR